MAKIFTAAVSAAAPHVYAVEPLKLAYDLASTEWSGKRGKLDGWTIRGPGITTDPAPWFAGQSGERVARELADALNSAAYVAILADRGADIGKGWEAMAGKAVTVHGETSGVSIAPATPPHNCRNVTANKGIPYPRSCPACGIGTCPARVPFAPPRNQAAELIDPMANGLTRDRHMAIPAPMRGPAVVFDPEAKRPTPYITNNPGKMSAAALNAGAASELIHPDGFGGTDEGSHYMSQTRIEAPGGPNGDDGKNRNPPDLTGAEGYPKDGHGR